MSVKRHQQRTSNGTVDGHILRCSCKKQSQFVCLFTHVHARACARTRTRTHKPWQVSLVISRSTFLKAVKFSEPPLSTNIHTLAHAHRPFLLLLVPHKASNKSTDTKNTTKNRKLTGHVRCAFLWCESCSNELRVSFFCHFFSLTI